MHLSRRAVLSATFLFASLLPCLRAQDGGGSGRWEGAFHAPSGDLRMEIDLARDSKGQLTGTYSNIERSLRGFPLSNIAAEGQSVRFVLYTAEGASRFDGELSADGQSMAGDFVTVEGFDVPFSMKRTGDPKLEAPPRSPGVGTEMEGKWAGMLSVNGKTLQLALTIANEPDGTSGGVLDLDRAVEIPVTRITQKDSSLTFDIKSAGGSYTGVLNAEGTALEGTYTEGQFAQSITFKRQGPAGRKP